MKITMKNTMLLIITLFLIMTIAFPILDLPITDAHTPPWEIKTWTYIVASPNVVGIGQDVQLVFWSNEMPPTASGAYGDRWDFKVDITKPDGTKETIGPITSDPVGNGFCVYSPTQLGNYTIVASVAEHKLTGYPTLTGAPSTNAYVNDTFLASTSKPAYFTVQEEPIAHWPGAPLPTDYWNRPIEGQNREWWTISGNWFEARGYNASSQGYYYKGGGFNPYTQGPSSAHIVWTKPFEMFGGLMGGDLSIDGGVGSYYTGMSYEQAYAPPIIMQGRLYYNTPPSAKPNYGTHCIDLRTGEEYWWQNITASYGQIYNYISPNQYGGTPYLWETGSTYKMYDGYTGNWILSLVNASTGTVAYGSDGSMLVYIFNGANNWFAMWNSSLAIWANMPNLWSSNNYWLWRPPAGRTDLDWRKGIQWNVTLADVPGTQSLQKVNSELAICRATFDLSDGTTIAEDMAYSVKAGNAGQRLWGPVNRTALPFGAQNLVSLVDGVYVQYIGETMDWYCYDANTGTQLWGPSTATGNAWAMYGGWRTLWAGYGKIYQPGMDGCIHCLDLKTGEKLWTFETESSGFEADYGNWPLISATFLGGAPDTGGLKIYAVGGHTHLQPLYRGAKLYCVDGETGELLWDIYGWFQAGGPVGADGYMAAVNGYDMQLYCFGKGQTATTVSGSPEVSIHGSSVLIKGKVTDQSPGAKDTPAISDASMSQWMEYLYMQKQKPSNATGVEVTLYVIDSNGNYRPIGVTTSDTDGFYSFDWTPDIEGKYTVIASFQGSESYWPSRAETAFVVNGVEPTPTSQPAVVLPPTEMYILGGVAAIIIAIAIGFAVTILMLRKRL